MPGSDDDINNNYPSCPADLDTAPAAEPSRFLGVVKGTSDPLLKHISSAGLPLKLRPPTRSDGNCWFDAVADQVKFDNFN